MTATWPADPFPQLPLAEGYSWQVGRGVVRSAVDAGVAQTRRRYSSALATVAATYWLTRAQVDEWTAFHSDDLAGGADWFIWPEPAGVAKTARLLEPPQLQPVAGGIRWRLDLRLEVVL